MSSDGEHAGEPDEAELLPDERETIAERIESIEDRDSHLSLEEVAEDLGIDLEE